MTVVLDGATLKEGADYTVAYTNNVEPGTATVTVTGAGKYSGTVSATFTIKAAEPGSTLDKSKLQALVDKVKGYNKADYQSGWDAFAVALADAQIPARPMARMTARKSPPPSRAALCPTPAPRCSVWVSPRSYCSPPPAPPTPSASAAPELFAA